MLEDLGSSREFCRYRISNEPQIHLTNGGYEGTREERDGGDRVSLKIKIIFLKISSSYAA